MKKAQSLPILEEASSHWERAFLLFASVDNPDTSISLSDLPKGLARQFFCLFTITFERQIFSRSKVSFLPTHLFLQATQLLQDLTTEKRPLWLLLLCGLFEPPGRDIIMLHWSPLRKEIPESTDGISLERIIPKRTDGLSEGIISRGTAVGIIPNGTDFLSTEGIFQCAKNWVLDKFSSSLKVFHENALNLWKLDFSPRCTFFLIRGSCTKRDGGCKFSHERVNVAHCSAKIAVSFTQPIYRIKMEANVNRSYSKSAQFLLV